jgi:uncharacterized protein
MKFEYQTLKFHEGIKMEREEFENRIQNFFDVNPVVAILGPRQCGKTTLARHFMAKNADLFTFHYFDLENPTDLAALDTPMPVLQSLEGIIIIDEIQRRPQLFPVLRVLVDEPIKRKFLILGSASRELIHQSSESLTGRISYLELTPFSLYEVDHLECLWLRGGFPKSYLAKTEKQSFEWREDYILTFLERDIPNLGINVPAKTMRRFWMMPAHYHGNIFNSSEIGSSMGVAHTTARRYLNILTGTFMIRELQPWYENIGKRQVKLPKIYFRDSGIFHTLLGITDNQELIHHPKMGASWEGFALEEVIRHFQAKPEEVYFWSVHSQAELDLLIVKKGKRLGFEIKFTDKPEVTTSMLKAKELLDLDNLVIVFPGKKVFSMDKGIHAIGLETLNE